MKRHSHHEQIRQATRQAHERLDKRIARHDVASPAGLALYLEMNDLGLSGIAPKDDAQGERLGKVIRSMQTACRADLRELGHTATSLEPACLTGGLGALYVLTGSRLGARFIERRVAQSTHAAVRDCVAFFAPCDADAAWTDVLSELSRATEAEMATIETEARAVFALFEGALRVAETRRQPPVLA